MSAIISECGRYRYELRRSVQRHGFKACVIMVNPSTADAEIDDATIRKIKGFAKGFQWSEFIVVNLFAYRATDVNELRSVSDPIGELNNLYTIDAMMRSDIVMVAWGASAKLPTHLRKRYQFIVDSLAAMNKPAYCLGVCADGHPKHPLMIGYATQLERWNAN